MTGSEALALALFEAIGDHRDFAYSRRGPGSWRKSADDMWNRLYDVPARALALLENAAPELTATPTRSGASPEGNGGDTGAAA